MKSKFIFLVFAIILGCSSSSDIPSDFSLSYSSRNALMNWEIKITIESKSLKLDYKNQQNGTSGNGVYDITESEAKTLYNYMKSSSFLSMSQPDGEKILDAPTQNITGKYGGKSNSIEFGTVKIPSETITTLKQILFDLSSKYNSKWKKDMNFE